MRVWLALLFAVLFWGCQTSEYPAPILGTAYRIDRDVPTEGSELRVDIFTTENECANAGIEETDLCLPYADRSTGELRLAFDLRDPTTGSVLFRSLDSDAVAVSHDSSTVDDIEVIPHDPVSSGQLFVLLIDGSGSMYENDGERVKKVYSALMTPSVIQGFLPEDNGKTGVVLLRFSNGVVGLDGETPRVIKTKAEYRKVIKEHLMTPRGGFTHLYDAVAYAVTELPKVTAIDRFMAVKTADPTVIVLTDGFNNQEAADTCGTNVSRLNDLLGVMHEGRRAGGVGSRSTVYTVGFGTRYRRGEKPDGFKQVVTPTGLCGKYADQRIDGHLEDYGIDHVSLSWIAEAGGGVSFVKKDSKGLAETFGQTSRARYRWYELHYRVDSFYHRRSFESKLRLNDVARGETTVRLYPSPWLDAPGGHRDRGERWVTATPFRRSLAFLMPLLGLLVLLTYIGPAFFNARRAVFRRARPRSRTPAPESANGKDAV